MELLTDNFWDRILELSKYHGKISISTYAFCAPLSLLGFKVCRQTQVAKVLNERSTRLIVGIPFQKEKDNSDLRRYSNIKVKFTPRHHMKLWIFERPSIIAIIGGHNFHPSASLDLSILLEGKQAKQLLSHFNQVWSSI